MKRGESNLDRVAQESLSNEGSPEHRAEAKEGRWKVRAEVKGQHIETLEVRQEFQI